MIEHIFIKNYKAFRKENIPLDRHTLLIGPNNSGKTTILEALDLFFNNKFHLEYVIDKEKDVVVELHINDQRYRKTYIAPNYHIDYKKCIGDMFDIIHIKYLYIPKKINVPNLLNSILSINLTQKPDSKMLTKIFKVSDYIDGIVGNNNYKLFNIRTNYEMSISEDIPFNETKLFKVISNITYQYCVIGIDNFESNFNVDSLAKITKYSYQTIITSNEKNIVKNYRHYVSTLYKGNKNDDLDTIKKRLSETNHKTYLLVEGKYDVNWFETALRLLDKENNYTVIPCGGSGNIAFVKEQLEKEGFKTLIIADGDTGKKGALKREIIEQYADLNFINDRFHTAFKSMPISKHYFFKQFNVKDDVVKNVLSRWAKKNLTIKNEFVQEVDSLLI